MKTISLNKLESRKHVQIDGHYYIVRKMGAGDTLAVSQMMRELDKLAKKEQESSLTDEELKRVTEIENESLAIKARCFDDQEDGSKAMQLVRSLSDDEMGELMRQIFEEEKPETNEPTPTESKAEEV